jgi:hypothetical protein
MYILVKQVQVKEALRPSQVLTGLGDHPRIVRESKARR